MKYISVLIFLLSTFTYAYDVKTYIPKGAQTYAPLLVEEQRRLWPEHELPYLLGGLTETESCISLTHSKCWNPKAKLSTSRELGIGMPQITKAYHADGSIRFDTLKDIRAQHLAELKEASWENIADRADLQLRILVLLNRTNFNKLEMISNNYDRYAMTDYAYNGGLRDLQKDRRLCGLKKDCDPQQWFDHVETTCSKSNKVMAGYGRSPCQIVHEHVDRVMRISSDKYKPFWYGK